MACAAIHLETQNYAQQQTVLLQAHALQRDLVTRLRTSSNATLLTSQRDVLQTARRRLAQVCTEAAQAFLLEGTLALSFLVVPLYICV